MTMSALHNQSCYLPWDVGHFHSLGISWDEFTAISDPEPRLPHKKYCLIMKQLTLHGGRYVGNRLHI